MPESDSTVIVRTLLGINLSSIRQLFPSLTFTSRRRSSRGDDNIDQAEYYIRVTEEQLDAIYNASQEASDSFADEINIIEGDLNELTLLLNTVKIARSGQSTLTQTRIQRLSNDDTTKDILKAARNLSRKAKKTSNSVCSKDSSESTTNIILQTAPSSEYTTVSGNELTAQANLCGIGFSFHGTPTEGDAKKIESIMRFVDPQLHFDDEDEQSGSIRVLRPRKSDLSTYSFHYWGPDAYAAREYRLGQPDTSNQPTSQCRASTSMQLGARAAFHQCHFNISNIQSNDSSAISDSALNLSGDNFVGQDIPPLPSAVHGRRSSCPLCAGSRGAPAIQASNVPLQDAAIDATRSASELHSSTVPPSPVQSNSPTITMQSPTEIHPGKQVIRAQNSQLTGTQDVQPVDYDDLPPDARISAIVLSTEANTQLTASFFTEAANFIASGSSTGR